MKQFNITTAMGKRLIGKAMAKHPEIEAVLQQGTLVIIAGTTNGYVAQEILQSIGQTEGFSRLGFRRGVTVAPGAKAPKAEFPGDVVIVDGTWLKGQTIYDVADSLKEGDVVLKGGNAFDLRGQPAVQIGDSKGGTALAATQAVVGRRVRLIVPVGLEKRVFEDVNVLAQMCCEPGATGPRLFPMLGEVFTELDAIELLTGAVAFLIAAGGVYGAEGAVWLGVDGTDQEIEAAAELIKSVSGEPPCEA
jgi:hypothetical protein